MSRRDGEPWLFAALAVITRVPFVPATLYDFDAAAFAEAVRAFNPILFHPHPPGYTLYVALTKLLAATGLNPEGSLAAASVLGSAATAWILVRYGTELAGPSAGRVAAALFLASPLAWTYGSAHGTYGLGAVAAVWLARAAWRRLGGAPIAPWKLALGAGLAAGFRPDVAVVLTPLLTVASTLAPGDRRRGRVTNLLEAALAGAFGLSLWIAPAVIACGSVALYHDTVVRQWQAVAYSNAEHLWSWLRFRAVNAAKLGVYGSFALGPAGTILLAWSIPRLMRDFRVEARTKIVLVAWLGGYAALSVLVAFGQPGMLLTALPAVCLMIGVALARFGDDLGAGVAEPLGWLAATASAAIFLWAPGLGSRGFFDAQAPLIDKVRSELELFTRPGLALVDRELGGQIAAIRRDFPPARTLVLTNVASSTRVMYALPEYAVSCYFAFSGFEGPILAHDVGEPRGTYPLPKRARWLVVVDVDQHALAVRDQVRARVTAGGRTVPWVKGEAHALDLEGIDAVRFRGGNIELVSSTQESTRMEDHGQTSSQPLAATIRSLWNFSDPAESERRFHAAAREAHDADRAELETQEARALGLQRRFDEAHRLLDQVEGRSPRPSPVLAVRLLLERGRCFNSAGDRDRARPLFVKAWEDARASNLEVLAIDAAHMVAIVESGGAALDWNHRALEISERSTDPDARRWKTSLENNLAWTHHDMGDFDRALEHFEKALAESKVSGTPETTRIAEWSVGRALRSLGRYDEALAIQRTVDAELTAAGKADPYVSEELGELLLATGLAAEARPHLAKAYAGLSQDEQLRASEPARIERLRTLAGESSLATSPGAPP